MTYQQAGRIAVVKRIAGWILFIPALLSTFVSLANYLYAYTQKKQGIDAVLLDFVHLMVDMVRFNTPFLNIFWYNSPVPDFTRFFSGATLMFWLIYILIFVGLALQVSGARMSRQAKAIKEGIEDQLILEKMKGDDGNTRETLESRVVVPGHTIFVQFFPLYILPVIVAGIGYLVLRLLGLPV
ncbi:YniB family protein [Pectobacterium brasiliense]|uniref:YniB family protein n=1 Tax=Pectobacterium brasiliense TaxID=180957 RepID=UPI0019691B36|nr:YniB family protein [Pectobacterium brasiliense]MBN3069337.1 YniB family protein [Pectobacterium brasiliense]MBN3123124.1 YniB family protein [Pectobacterium brasiliense]MBN3247267.1 YniB family protein [Pectobacterium brasiliense]QSD20983.1 YniB family protein [Pectobacterium brasiliense]